ncbi:MAG: hypothetical protein ACI8QC_002723 [Planctomycetota bacterium]|jgi:hypothetical protein
MRSSLAGAFLAFAALLPATALSQSAPNSPGQDFHTFHEAADGTLVGADANGTYTWATYGEYFASNFFQNHDKRCGTAPRDATPNLAEAQADCNSTNTTVAAQYDPNGGATYVIPVVVHILIHNNGSGDMPDSRVTSQIDVLNADFANVTNSKIQFTLAGITRSVNRHWYNDNKAYYNTLAWDTNRYLNIYTNTAGGNLGYAYLPSGGGVVGQAWDGVRINHNAMGVNPAYAPYDLGRTATHEVGHYLGLYHTFDDGCHGGNCNQAGDLICDTAPEASPNYSSCGIGSRNTCSGGGSDPIENYMDYSYDVCMDRFSAEQANRMRCTMENFRVDLDAGTPSAPGQAGSPSPADGASGVATSAGLSWSAGNGATSSDVYFGLSSSLGAGDLLGSTSGSSMSPGSLAESTTYFWRVDSVNGTGTTGGAVWSFTTDSGPPSGGDLFYDGFESGLIGSAWSTSGNVSATGQAAYAGAFGAQIRSDGSMSFQVDTSGVGSATLSFRSYVQNYESGEALTVSVNGSVVATLTNSSWGLTDNISLPSGSAVTVSFSTNANRNNERGRLDEVRVVGN